MDGIATVKDAHRELKLRTDSAESRGWARRADGAGRAKVNAAAGGADDDDDDDDDDDGPESIRDRVWMDRASDVRRWRRRRRRREDGVARRVAQ